MASDYSLLDTRDKRLALTAFSPVIGMLYSAGQESKQFRAMMSSVPILGSVFQYEDRQRYLDDYFANTGLSWDDVKYPSIGVTGNTYNIVGQATNFVSKNIMRLYR